MVGISFHLFHLFQYMQASFLVRRVPFNQALVTVFVKLVASSETPPPQSWHHPRLQPLPPLAHLPLTLRAWASSQVRSPRHCCFPRYHFDPSRPLIQVLTKPQAPCFEPRAFATHSFIFSAQHTTSPSPGIPVCRATPSPHQSFQVPFISLCP